MQDNLSQAEEDQLTEAYQKVFMGNSTPQEGQLVLWDLINLTYVFRQFNQQNAGAYAMEGKREIGLMLMQKLHLSPKSSALHPLKVMARLEDSISSAEKLRLTSG